MTRLFTEEYILACKIGTLFKSHVKDLGIIEGGGRRGITVVRCGITYMYRVLGDSHAFILSQNLDHIHTKILKIKPRLNGIIEVYSQI